MDRLTAREFALEAELEALAQRHPLYPRAWHEEVERRVARTGLETEEIVFYMRAERNLVPRQPVTTASLIDCERRYLALFELDELLPEPTGAAVASSSAD
jgi:hypothetical protein